MPNTRRFLSLLLSLALVLSAVPAYGVSSNYYNSIAYTSPSGGLLGGLAGGEWGVVYRVGGGGSIVTSSTLADRPVAGLDASGTSAWAVITNSDRPMYSSDSGASWQQRGVLQYNGAEPWPADVDMLSSGKVVVVGQGKGVSDYSGDARGDIAFIDVSDDGATWRKAYSEPTETAFLPGDIPVTDYSLFNDVDESPDGSLALAVGTSFSDPTYNVVARGMLSRSIDGGATWSNTATLPPNVATHFDARAVAVSSGQVAYAFAGNQYFYWKTTDGGLTWSAPTKLTGASYFHARGADSRDASTAVVVGEGTTSSYYGTIYYTHSGGATWTKATLPAGSSTPKLLDVQMVTDSFWVAVGENNYLLATRNSGTTWEVPDSIPPTVTVTGVADDASYTSTVTPIVSVTGATTQTITLDGNPFVSGTPVSADGTHTLNVVATDTWNNTTNRTVTFRITMDRIPPEIAIAGVTNGATYNATVTPVVTVTGATTQTITLDGARFASGSAVSAQGAHTLDVWARDLNGNVATASATFAIDRNATGPDIAIGGVTEGAVYEAAVAPTVTVSGEVTKTITLDGLPFEPGTPFFAEGLHILRVFATNLAGTSAERVVSFGIAPKAFVRSLPTTLAAYDQSCIVTGTVEFDGTPRAGRRVELWYSANGSSFLKSSSVATTSADGAYSFTLKPRTTTYYAVRSAATNTLPASGISNAVKIVAQAYMGNPVAPSTMYRTRYYTVYNYLKPRHTSGSRPVKIFKYRYVASYPGHWKPYGYVYAKAANYSSTTSKCSVSLRLPYAGKWRLRAYHIADAGHPAKWSAGYDYVTVR